MKKIICNSSDCANKGVIYFMPIKDEKVMCGGCKVWLDAIIMTDVEIKTTFDYDFKSPSMLGQ